MIGDDICSREYINMGEEQSLLSPNLNRGFIIFVNSVHYLIKIPLKIPGLAYISVKVGVLYHFFTHVPIDSMQWMNLRRTLLFTDMSVKSRVLTPSLS